MHSACAEMLLKIMGVGDTRSGAVPVEFVYSRETGNSTVKESENENKTVGSSTSAVRAVPEGR